MHSAGIADSFRYEAFPAYLGGTMRRPRIAIAATALLAVLLLLLVAVPAFAAPHPVIPTDDPALQGPGWVDGTTMLGAQEKQYRQMAAALGAQAMIQNPPQTVQPAAYVGQTFTVDVSNMDPNHAGTYTEHFVVQSIGAHGIICVTQAAYDGFDGTNYHFANPNGNGSSTWLRTEDLVTRGQLSYLLNSFDTTIWNTEAPVWGTPLARGSEGQKVWILIYNLIDDAYYNPNVGSYVAGYFSGSEDAQNTKNMMHIDTYDWADRIGGDASRPYLYEGVFAHEYQHLLHADIDPDEEAWVDEGMADLAAFLCGYMKDNTHVMYYMAYHPWTSLTFWGGNLENYGASYLFQLYLWENYGGNAFTKALLHDQANGIQGVQDQLNRFGKGVTFSKVFDNWTLANYFDRTGPSQYGYKNINLGPDTNGWTIPKALAIWEDAPMSQPFTYTGSSFWGTAPQPYTAQYYLFDTTSSIKAFLDGDDQAGVAAHSGSRQMVSGQGTWAWKSFYLTGVPITTGTNALSFWTSFDIEEDWDYGYIEIYDETSQQWYTMPATDDSANPLTTNTLPQIQDNPNVPAGREPSDYYNAGLWNAFTGSSGGWVHANVSLAGFLGHTIDIYFRTWQDGSTTFQMMYVDDVRLQYGSADYLENFDSNSSQWLTPHTGDTAGWTLGTGLLQNNWQGTLVSIGDQLFIGKPRFIPFPIPPILKVFATPINPATQSGTVNGTPQFKQMPKWLYIVSNRADHILTSDYYLHVWR
jgi:Immune inhibitor A peptidase M6